MVKMDDCFKRTFTVLEELFPLRPSCMLEKEKKKGKKKRKKEKKKKKEKKFEFTVLFVCCFLV